MKKELILIEYDKTIQEAMEKIIFNKTRTIFVTKNYKVIGTISEGDILRSLYDKKNLQTPLINIINKNLNILMKKILRCLKQNYLKVFCFNYPSFR